jgi:hypothetical protein
MRKTKIVAAAVLHLHFAQAQVCETSLWDGGEEAARSEII